MILSSTSDLALTPQSIVSLVPSQTELLYYLGLADEVTGITKFCIHPKEWHRNKLKVGGTKTIDIQKIKHLQPQLIIANKEENIKEQVQMLAADFNVWVSDVNNFSDALKMIDDIGLLVSKKHKAEQLIKKIETEFDTLSKQIFSTQNSQFIFPYSPIPTCYLVWNNPYMTVGSDTFISDIMRLAGFKNIFAHRKRYPEINLHELKTLNCKLLLLSSEPYPFKEKHIEEIQKQLPEIKIMLTNGEMFSWYGSRLLQAPGYLKKLVDDFLET